MRRAARARRSSRSRCCSNRGNLLHPSPRHEDVRTTMRLYAQSDRESRLEAQGKFLALLLGDKAHLLTETIQ
jgi:hypothetical protein